MIKPNTTEPSKVATKKLASVCTLIVAISVISGCVSGPQVGTAHDYKRLKKGKINVKPAKEPRFISQEALEQLGTN